MKSLTRPMSPFYRAEVQQRFTFIATLILWGKLT